MGLNISTYKSKNGKEYIDSYARVINARVNNNSIVYQLSILENKDALTEIERLNEWAILKTDDIVKDCYKQIKERSERIKLEIEKLETDIPLQTDKSIRNRMITQLTSLKNMIYSQLTDFTEI